MTRGARRSCGSRLSGVILSTFLLLFSGCRPEGDRSARDRGSSAPTDEVTLTVLHPSNEWLFSPSYDGSPKFLVFLPLVNPGLPTGGEPGREPASGEACPGPTGALAESWEPSPDRRTWTVRLREGIRWHDGEPVTAHDVAFTVKLWHHPEVDHYAGFELDSAVALDDHTVRFHLKRPGDWPLNLWYVFYPKRLLEDLDPAAFFEWEFWTRPVGNGPFRYVRHVPETMVELEANPEHYTGRPVIDRLRIKFSAAGSGTGLLELRSGEVDLVGIGLHEAEPIASDPRFRIHFGLASASSAWLLWNPRHPLFETVRIRRALTQAIDRRAMHRLLLIPERAPVTDGPYTPCQFWRRAWVDPWPHDPDAAGRLLEESDWRDEEGNGVLERDGREFRFTILTDESNRRAAVFVQDQLRRVGVRAEIGTLEASLVRARVDAGRFDAAIRVIGGRGLTALLSDDLQSGASGGGLTSPLEALATAIRREPDSDRRDSLYVELARAWRAELPATRLHPTPEVIVTRREVRGLTLPEGDLRPTWRWPFGGLEHLRWEEEPEDELLGEGG